MAGQLNPCQGINLVCRSDPAIPLATVDGLFPHFHVPPRHPKKISMFWHSFSPNRGLSILEALVALVVSLILLVVLVPVALVHLEIIKPPAQSETAGSRSGDALKLVPESRSTTPAPKLPAPVPPAIPDTPVELKILTPPAEGPPPSSAPKLPPSPAPAPPPDVEPSQPISKP